MSAFDRLHPAVQHHIVNSLGWSSLHPLQEAAIAPILEGKHALLLAPTAGGKTEAAVFPLLSRMLSEGWPPLSLLYICPLKALLNNLEARLLCYAGLVGRTVGVWHGDIGPTARARIGREPPDILLVTPESLEVVLVSRRVDHRAFFATLRAAVVDEVHAFAGDDRGWHLIALLERISRLSDGSLQRLGLSATVGNPEELLQWLAPDSAAAGEVVTVADAAATDAEVELDYVGSLPNAAVVISRLHRGEKRLVFCDSRSQVEDLAAELRGLGVRTYVSHSSLSADHRRQAERAFSEGENCVIVATSTLELGIDVGDLDRVIQIDAPYSVAAFLQRLGRTGRRPGTTRNCLFLATTDEAFARALGLLQLWRDGYVEPVIPPPLPYQVLAQQVMALALQEGGIGRWSWRDWLDRFLEISGISQDDADAIIRHMIESRILYDDAGLLSLGAAGESRFGLRNFLELFSVFSTAPTFAVLHGGTHIGDVHPLTFQIAADQPLSLTLGGRYWTVKFVDWRRRRAYVEPTDARGRSRWLSSGRPLHFHACQAVAKVLSSGELDVKMSKRALRQLAQAQDQFAWVDGLSSALVKGDDGLTWWTFAGRLFNAAAAAQLRARGYTTRYDNYSVSLGGGGRAPFSPNDVRELLHDTVPAFSTPLAQAAIADIKFIECVPPSLVDRMTAARFDQSHVREALLRAPLGSLAAEPDVPRTE